MKLLLENWRKYLKEEINDKTKESLLTLAFHHEEAEREMALSLAQSLGIDLVSLVRSELALGRAIIDLDLIDFHSRGWTDYGYHNDFEFQISMPKSLANKLKLRGPWRWSRLFYETDENLTDAERDKTLFGIANDFDGLSEKLKKDTGLPVELANNKHFLKLISDEMKKDTAGL